jgi:hypothetical protein
MTTVTVSRYWGYKIAEGRLLDHPFKTDVLKYLSSVLQGFARKRD